MAIPGGFSGSGGSSISSSLSNTAQSLAGILQTLKQIDSMLTSINSKTGSLSNLTGTAGSSGGTRSTAMGMPMGVFGGGGGKHAGASMGMPMGVFGGGQARHGNASWGAWAANSTPSLGNAIGSGVGSAIGYGINASLASTASGLPTAIARDQLFRQMQPGVANYRDSAWSNQAWSAFTGGDQDRVEAIQTLRRQGVNSAYTGMSQMGNLSMLGGMSAPQGAAMFSKMNTAQSVNMFRALGVNVRDFKGGGVKSGVAMDALYGAINPGGKVQQKNIDATFQEGGKMRENLRQMGMSDDDIANIQNLMGLRQSSGTSFTSDKNLMNSAAGKQFLSDNVANIRKSESAKSDKDATKWSASMESFGASVNLFTKATKAWTDVLSKTGLGKAMGSASGIKAGIEHSGAMGLLQSFFGPILGRASGGVIPGNHDRDDVPIFATPGEVVVPKSVVRRHGGASRLMRALGFNGEGGNHFATGGEVGQTYQQIEAMANGGPPHIVTSTTGGGHASGSYHYKGQAVDFSVPGNDPSGLAKIDRYFASTYGSQLSELIYGGPGGISIKDGKVVDGNSFYGASTMSEHLNHVHVAMRNGAAVGAVPTAAGGGSSGGSSAGLGWGRLGKTMSGSVLHYLMGAYSNNLTHGGSGGSGGSGGAPAAAGGGRSSLSGNRALGKNMAAAMGWAGAEWDALDKLWAKESSWDAGAVNKSSGAYGIPQANPSGGQGHPYALNDPGAQITWGLNYIKGRYGSPSAAWQHETAMNWYSNGSWNTKAEVAHLHEGEMVLPASVATQVRRTLGEGGHVGNKTGAGMSAGGGRSVTINVFPAKADATEAKRLAQMVKRYLDDDQTMSMIGRY